MKFIIPVFICVLAASLNLGAPVLENSLTSTNTGPGGDSGMYYDEYNYVLAMAKSTRMLDIRRDADIFVPPPTPTPTPTP